MPVSLRLFENFRSLQFKHLAYLFLAFSLGCSRQSEPATTQSATTQGTGCHEYFHDFGPVFVTSDRTLAHTFTHLEPSGKPYVFSSSTIPRPCCVPLNVLPSVGREQSSLSAILRFEVGGNTGRRRWDAYVYPQDRSLSPVHFEAMADILRPLEILSPPPMPLRLCQGDTASARGAICAHLPLGAEFVSPGVECSDKRVYCSLGEPQQLKSAYPGFQQYRLPFSISVKAQAEAGSYTTAIQFTDKVHQATLSVPVHYQVAVPVEVTPGLVKLSGDASPCRIRLRTTNQQQFSVDSIKLPSTLALACDPWPANGLREFHLSVRRATDTSDGTAGAGVVAVSTSLGMVRIPVLLLTPSEEKSHATR